MTSTMLGRNKQRSVLVIACSIALTRGSKSKIEENNYDAKQ